MSGVRVGGLDAPPERVKWRYVGDGSWEVVDPPTLGNGDVVELPPPPWTAEVGDIVETVIRRAE